MADGSAPEIRFYTASQLVGLPGLPTTVQGIRIAATRGGWVSRPRDVGKGCEYSEQSLPEFARRELHRRAAIAAANTAQPSPDFAAGQTISRRIALREKIDESAAKRIREAGIARAAGLTGKARARMDAKLDVLARVREFAQHHGLGVCAAREGFCAALRSGEIVIADNVKRFLGDVSPASVGRWQRMLATQGAAALAGEYGNRKGTSAIETQQPLRDFALGLLTDKPHISAKNMHRSICARFGQLALEIPTERTTARFLAKFKSENAQLYTAIANPDAWKNRYMSAFGSASEDVHRLNQRWELDSTPADVMLVDGRHTIVQVVDIWSRRRLFYVAKTSSGAAVCQAIRRALLAWGVPEVAKIDNGKDYVGERAQRAFSALGIDVETSNPFSPWEKPHVESGFKLFLHGIFELLSGYIGHDVADQQAIRASKSFAERMFKKNEVVDVRLTAAELQTFCDRWCASLYQHEQQDCLHGQSVFQRVASWTGEIRRIENERALDILLAEAPDGDGGRTVSKKGIRIDRLTYIAPELHGMVGERVNVLYDERDAGRIVVYQNEQFCCIAECPEILGVSRQEIAAEANAQRKAGIAAKRAEMQALKRKANVKDIAFEILDAKERENAALSALPLAENVLHLTPAIEAAQEAAAALDDTARAEAKHVGEVRDEFFKVLGEARFAGRLVRTEEEEIEARFKIALDVLKKDPADRTAFDQSRIAGYCKSNEFRGRWNVLQSFGATAFLTLDETYNCFHEEGALADRLREFDRLMAPLLDN